MNKRASGFTIVELLIVIVVIAILAAITIVAYNGIQQRASYSRMRSDMASLNKAIQLYYADRGSYPVTPTTAGTYCSGNWCGFGQAKNDSFIPGLVPTYIASTPQQQSSSNASDTYLYRSLDGKDYKLIRYLGSGLSAGELSAMSDLETTGCSPATTNTNRWGYWSSDASKCW